MELSEFKSSGNLLVGSCGTISVLNLHNWILQLKKNFCLNIKIILTEKAAEFINIEALKIVTGCEVFVSFQSDTVPTPHVNLLKWADLYLVLPASANTLSKVANGISDNLITTSILNAEIPVVFVPSMNKVMWEKSIIQKNINILREEFYIEYTEGDIYKVSSGEYDKGLIVDIDKLLIKLMRIVKKL